jgi:signal transduction histidine kinase
LRFFRRAPTGLIGRIFAILLLTLLIESGISTLLYERASRFSLRDDEAHRLAEHLVIARKLVSEQPVSARKEMADELTTSRYEVVWRRALPPLPPIAPALDRMAQQVLAWEPELAGADLQLRLTSPGRNARIVGGLRLPDNSWIYFRTRDPLGKFQFAFERILLALVPAIALILIGGLLVRQTLLPMRKLSEAADRVGSGDDSEVPEIGPGEVRKVIQAFNRMQARIHRLIFDRTQALAAVGHDLRTPLARLRLRADGVADAETRDALHSDLIEMEAMIASLLSYLSGESDTEQPVAIDLAVLCASLVDDAGDRGRAAQYVGPDHLELRVRPIGFKRALVNLTENALHYADALTIAVVEHADAIEIRFDDNGPGIPDEALETVMEPFVRLDPARARDTVGFGLGLAIVRRAVMAEGGSFTLTNRTGGGLSARIRLPVISPQA